MATGSIGSSGQTLTFNTPRSINLTMPANTYPRGTFTMTDIKSDGAYWKNNNSRESAMNLYLCDSAGNNKVLLFEVRLSAGGSSYNYKTATLSGTTASALKGKALYLIAETTEFYGADGIVLKNATSITVDTYTDSFSITCSAGTGGTLSANKSAASPGETITLTPTPSTGYQFSGYSSSPSVSISNNKFTMPSSNVTITANFTKISYAITKGASPSGAGTVTTSANSATMGTTVTVSQTPATGYYFNGWTTSPSLTITNGAFTMPASAVSITARYLRRSTGSLSAASMTGGGSVTLTISTESTGYSHKYKLSFGTNMETALTNVAAGTTSVSISVPASWSNYIPNATSKGSGTLTLETYSGSTKIGTYTITGLTYNVPSSAIPSIGTITTSIARTIGSTTYANVGDYYVQNHSGVRIQTSASGSYSSTISSVKAELVGYSGSSYVKTVSAASIDFTTGLLTISGTATIKITATDSRGRTNTKTATITVTAYANPSGSLAVWRTDVNGDDDEWGIYAKYMLTKAFTAIGSNSLTVKINNITTTDDTGFLEPGNKIQYSIQQEYIITLSLTDAFETTTYTAKVKSGRFVIYVYNDGTKMGFMKAANKTIPSGKDSTIEFSGSSQIYIGDETLEAYIRRIAGS